MPGWPTRTGLWIARIGMLTALLMSTPCPIAEASHQEGDDGAAEHPNIVLILIDDHRHDALGFLGEPFPFLETPNLDRLAREGAYFPNAFVTTSLCSPSRASILTGLYAHNHGVVDNYNPVSDDLTFFPEQLQEVGYRTGFIGKWHMGDVDDPQRGFDHWVAFRGQGTYYPDGRGTSRVVPQTSNDGFNINGVERVPQTKYITDELTDYAIQWIDEIDRDRPYFLYLSHKAVHSDFVPADRHRGRYDSAEVTLPSTFRLDEELARCRPRWVRDQRNSRHGVDFAYNLPAFDLKAYIKRYSEALLAVDENVGRLREFLERKGDLDRTVIVYLGDNGFLFGEHGLIDKRVAYETSIRIPLLMRGPGLEPGSVVEPLVANIDIAPTLLEAAGAEVPPGLDGQSAWDVARGEATRGRRELLYEYYWEWNYPYTPTIHALRTDRYKYIRPYGVWDVEELYDLQADPEESTNLIADPDYREVSDNLKRRLFEQLAASDGEAMPLRGDRGRQFPWRHPERSDMAPFPARLERTSEPPARP